MKSVLFCRVSSKEQEEVGYSLPSQQKLLSEYSEKKDFEVARSFAISESASGKHQRKAFIEMMKYVDTHHIKIIICEKTDRLTRNLKDAVSIYAWLDQDDERQMHLVKDSLVLHKNSRSQEKLNLDMRIVFAKNYIDNLSEEVKKGQKEKIEQGWYPARPKLGYKSQEINGRINHVIDDKHALFIKRMFELYDQGNHSVERLAELLFQEGFRSRDGKKVVTSRIHSLLQDPFFYGVFEWNGVVYKGNHSPLISKELYDRVQYRLKSKITPKVQKHLFLFKGLLRCKTCLGTISFETHKGIVYGHCHHYKPCNDDIWVREDKLEKQVKKALIKLQINNKRVMEWIRKALKESNQDISLFHTNALNELHDQLKAVDKRMSNLYDDKVDEVITKEFYDQKSKEYKTQKVSIEGAIAKHNNAHNQTQDLSVKFYELSQRAESIYDIKKTDKKRILLQVIYAKLFLYEGKLVFEYTKGFSILAKLVELTNKSSKVEKFKENTVNTFEPLKSIVPVTYTPNFSFLDPALRRVQDLNLCEPCGSWD